MNMSLCTVIWHKQAASYLHFKALHIPLICMCMCDCSGRHFSMLLLLVYTALNRKECMPAAKSCLCNNGQGNSNCCPFRHLLHASAEEGKDSIFNKPSMYPAEKSTQACAKRRRSLLQLVSTVMLLNEAVKLLCCCNEKYFQLSAFFMQGSFTLLYKCVYLYISNYGHICIFLVAAYTRT